MKHGHPCGHSSGGAQRRTEIVLTTLQEYEPNDPELNPQLRIPRPPRPTSPPSLPFTVPPYGPPDTPTCRTGRANGPEPGQLPARSVLPS
jgi:hypothetical protein